MAIFIYCEKCKKTVEPNSCEHKVQLKRDSMRNYINMRTTWSGQTKVEFSSKTMSQDIADRNRV
jgi:ATP sulfurylase|tara:strand:+ start:474 stop:665 length:192 start_codon:yes stop_codon:yes gene_type:complete